MVFHFDYYYFEVNQAFENGLLLLNWKKRIKFIIVIIININNNNDYLSQVPSHQHGTTTNVFPDNSISFFLTITQMSNNKKCINKSK